MVQWENENKNRNVPGKRERLNKRDMKNKILKEYLQACHVYLTKIIY